MKNQFIGIDFSKEKIDVVIVSAEGLSETAPKVYNTFKTTTAGYKQLEKWVKQNSKGIDPSQWLFCGENTGDYSKNSLTSFTGKVTTCGLRMQSALRMPWHQKTEIRPCRCFDDSGICHEKL